MGRAIRQSENSIPTSSLTAAFPNRLASDRQTLGSLDVIRHIRQQCEKMDPVQTRNSPRNCRSIRQVELNCGT